MTEPTSPPPAARSARPRIILVLTLLALAVVAFPFWRLASNLVHEQRFREAKRLLAARTPHIPHAELLDLMHNRPTRLVILDVRELADYNAFHLAGAVRVDPRKLDAPAVRNLPTSAIKVLLSNDESGAEAAFKFLHARQTKNLYILSGGINRWLDIYAQLPSLTSAPCDDDTPRYTFPRPVGSDHPAAKPDRQRIPTTTFAKKIPI